MSGSGGSAVSRTHGGDRFYNPPQIRHQKMLLQQERLQKQQLLRPVKSDTAAADNRTDSDESTTTLSKPTPSVCSSYSPPRPPPTDVTNLDRLVESVTPFIPARHAHEVNGKGRKTRESDMQPYYCLGDLWESFRKWSVYGAGVPLLLNGKDSIMQYYVPSLSGMQLYVDPRSRIRKPGEESDAESSQETSSAGSSDCEAERRAKSVVDASCSRMNRLSLSEKSIMSSSSDEVEMSSSPGTLLFEFLEHEPPYNRRPLSDKVSLLASQFPDLRSCDLLPSSWISVAWYPIYRIPMGGTLRDLDASFLTFHSLSTRSRSNGRWQFHGASDGKVHRGIDASPNISLPAFGLASYKLKGSILTPTGPEECEQENTLLQSADNWLRSLQVNLPDYKFFLSHYSQWR